MKYSNLSRMDVEELDKIERKINKALLESNLTRTRVAVELLGRLDVMASRCRDETDMPSHPRIKRLDDRVVKELLRITLV